MSDNESEEGAPAQVIKFRKRQEKKSIVECFDDFDDAAIRFQEVADTLHLLADKAGEYDDTVASGLKLVIRECTSLGDALSETTEIARKLMLR